MTRSEVWEERVKKSLKLPSLFHLKFFQSSDIRTKIRQEIFLLLKKNYSLNQKQEMEVKKLLDLKNSPPKLPFANVSISHCLEKGGFLLFEKGLCLGLDIEKTSRIRLEILERICQEVEIEKAPLKKHFLWPAKEASFKALSPHKKTLCDVHIDSWEKLPGDLFMYKFEILSFQGVGCVFEMGAYSVAVSSLHKN